MDGDGSEQTGWNVLYLHIANKNRVVLGQWVDQNGLIGHASCEGGSRPARMYTIAREIQRRMDAWRTDRSRWMMNGWAVMAGDKPYLGNRMVNRVVTADANGQVRSLIVCEDNH
ncbi:MAG: hypothetical protein MZV64_24030 [Ignavibacteriales bacterium]|nr:hypothetical protein [Ignavibacteriales bacterium]